MHSMDIPSKEMKSSLSSLWSAQNVLFEDTVLDSVVFLAEEAAMVVLFLYLGNCVFSKLQEWQTIGSRGKVIKGKGEKISSENYKLMLQKTNGEEPRKPLAAYDFVRLDERMNAMNDMDSSMTSGHYAGLIRSSVQGDKLQQAIHYFDRMEDAGHVPDLNLYTIIISGYAHRKNIRSAEAWLERLKRNQPYGSLVLAYNSVVNAAAQVGDLEKAIHWFKDMKTLWPPCEPDVFTYTSIINAAAEAKLPRKAEEWFEALLSVGLKPTVASYNSVMKAWIRSGVPQNVVKWFERLKSNPELDPNEISFSTLLNAFNHNSFSDGLQRTEACLEELISLGVVPTTKIYSRIICSCAQAKNTAKAEYWFKRMRSQDIRPDHQTYNSIINAMAQSGKLKKAEEWFLEMKKHGFQPDIISYTQLMNACAESENGERAEFWFNEMQANGNGIKPDKFAYNTLIKAWGRARNVHKTVSWFHAMKKDGVDPCEVSYSSVIRAASRAGEPEIAEAFLTQMIDGGHNPGNFNFNAVIQSYATEGKALHAEKWLERTFARFPPQNTNSPSSMGIPPTHGANCGNEENSRKYALTCVVKALAKENYAEKAQKWAQELCRAGGKLDFGTARVLVETMAHAEYPVWAMNWFDQHACEMASPPVSLFNVALGLCTPWNRRNHPSLLNPLRILEEMRRRGVSPDDETRRIVDDINSELNPMMQSWLRDVERRGIRNGNPPTMVNHGLNPTNIMAPLKSNAHGSMTDRQLKFDVHITKSGVDLDVYLEKLKEQHIKPDTQVFEAFINHVGIDKPGSGSPEDKAMKAERYLRRMLEVVGEPISNHVFFSVIRAFAKAKEPQKAEEWIQYLYEKKRRVPTIIHNTVIDCWASLGVADRACHWLEVMDKNPETEWPRPDHYSYNGVIKACAYAKDGEKAEYWFKRMLDDKTIFPDLVTYNGMINAWARDANIEKAEEWLQRIRDDGQTPDAISYQVVLKACVNAHEPEKTEHWLEQMENGGKHNILPSLVHYNSVLDAWARAKNLARAEEWLMSTAKRSNGTVKPNTQSYNILLKACANVNDCSRGDYWFNFMAKNGIIRDYWSYKQYSFCYLNSGNMIQAKKIMNEAESLGLRGR